MGRIELTYTLKRECDDLPFPHEGELIVLGMESYYIVKVTRKIKPDCISRCSYKIVPK